MRELFTTSVISATTAARPEQVWQALTCANANLGVPCGLAIVSGWVPGGSVRLNPIGEHTAIAQLASEGEVLAVVAPFRLTYSLGAGSGGVDPTAFVTWEIEANPGGSTVILTVDDLAPHGPEDHEIRSAWNDTVTALTRALDRATPHEDPAGDR